MLRTLLQRLKRRLQRRPTSKNGDVGGDFNERGPVYQRYARLYLQEGESALLATLQADGLSRKEESLLLRQLVEESGDSHRRHTLRLANRAWKLHTGAQSARTFAAGLHATGAFSEAIRVLQSSHALEHVPGSWQRLSKELQILSELAARLPAIPPKADTPAYVPRPDALLWVAPGSVAVESETPSIRIYEMALELLSLYPETLVVTPPGYLRRKPKAPDTFVGALAYQYTPLPPDFGAGGPLAWSVCHFEQILRAHRPAAVIAASDLFSSLPALIAARRLGIPYLLDASSPVRSSPTELSALEQKIEAHCAAHADALISPVQVECKTPTVTIPHPLALSSHLAPRPSGTVFTLGVAVGEEVTLDLGALSQAIAQVSSPVRLEISGPVSPELVREAAALNLPPDTVVFSIAPPALLLREWMARLDAILLPPGVSDYRFVEALAIGLPVLTTNPAGAPPAAEGAPQPICVPSGDPTALAQALTSLVEAPDACEVMGAAARQWAAGHRIGPRAVAELAALLRQMTDTAVSAAGSRPEDPADTSLPVTPASEVFLLTRRYPSPTNIYSYGFIHSRLRIYAQHRLTVDLYKVTPDTSLQQDDYEGIRVTSCTADIASRMARSERYRVALVHFLDPAFWNTLLPAIHRLKVYVWVHGADIQGWWQRGYELDGLPPEVVARRRADGALRQAFWRQLFLHPHPNLHFIFVSHSFAEEAFADIGVCLPPDRYSIIHNVIDSDIFTYRAKTADDRLRLLSIRPYSYRTSANDLTAAAIIELSKRPFFKELTIRLVGDGPLFDEVTAPLRDFDNVELQRGFLPQTEIARLHAQYGVFVVPTRADTQGVSRDEAMASGLVPITSNVGAIPEFVDAGCGIVTEPEDPIAIADAVEYLYHHPEEYLKLSAAAAARVRRQSGLDQTLLKELRLIQEALG